LKWKPIEFEQFENYRDSGETAVLPSSYWPTWAKEKPQYKRIVIQCPSSSTPLVSIESTAQIIAKLITERYDEKDHPKPYNYNFHILVESTNGSILQSGPIKTTNPPHHLSSPSTWLNELEPPST
jgi:hypothetical protein